MLHSGTEKDILGPQGVGSIQVEELLFVAAPEEGGALHPTWAREKRALENKLHTIDASINELLDELHHATYEMS